MTSYLVFDWMVRDFDLSGNELLLFAAIHQSIFFRSGCFFGYAEDIQELTGIKTEDDVILTLQSLIDKGLIEFVSYKIRGEKRIGISVTKKVLNR